MFRRLGEKRRVGKTARGQTMVEFAICIPVFMLFVFGIFQAVLIYKTQLALNQAATDAAQVLAAQSSNGAPTGVASQADAPALAALRSALTTSDLGNLSGMCSDGSEPTYNAASHIQSCANGSTTSGVDVFSDDGTGNPKTWSVDTSEDLQNNPLATAETISLDNHYVYMPNATGAQCPSDQFSLTNNLDNGSPIPRSSIITGSTGVWNACALPWNGLSFDPTTRTGNQNGRHDQRCDEEIVGVKIRYNYFSAAFPVHWAIQLVGSTSMPIEPRQYVGNSATLQA
ncbi:MAG: TadE/TadG family type IV pilus assembly protein [Chloroflexota bacterium]